MIHHLLGRTLWGAYGGWRSPKTSKIMGLVQPVSTKLWRACVAAPAMDGYPPKDAVSPARRMLVPLVAPSGAVPHEVRDHGLREEDSRCGGPPRGRLYHARGGFTARPAKVWRRGSGRTVWDVVRRMAMTTGTAGNFFPQALEPAPIRGQPFPSGALQSSDHQHGGPLLPLSP